MKFLLWLVCGVALLDVVHCQTDLDCSGILTEGPMEQYGTQEVYIPSDSMQYFICNSSTTQVVLQWRVVLEGDRDFTGVIINADMNNGLSEVTEENSDMISSVLTVNMTLRSDVMEITCRLNSITNSGQQCVSTVRVHVFGPPPAPTNISVTVIGPQHVNIYWQTDTPHPNINVTFTLTITSTPAAKQYLMEHTGTTHLEVMLGNTSQCEELRFEVVAENDAGTSPPGNNTVTRNVPSLPNVQQVEMSLEHRVFKENGDLSIHISHEPASVCRDDPVISYTAYLETQGQNTTQLSVSSSVEDNILEYSTSEGIVEDSLYHYHIMVTNGVGEVRTATRECYTSDVQRVCGVLGEDGVSVWCWFIDDSDATGCRVTLTSDNITTTASLTIDPNTGLATGKIAMDTSILSTASLHAADIEANGHISDLKLPGKLTNRETFCAPPPSATPGSSPTALVVGILVPLVLLLVIVGVVTGGVLLYTFKHRRDIDTKMVVSPNSEPSVHQQEEGIVHLQENEAYKCVKTPPAPEEACRAPDVEEANNAADVNREAVPTLICENIPTSVEGEGKKNCAHIYQVLEPLPSPDVKDLGGCVSSSRLCPAGGDSPSKSFPSEITALSQHGVPPEVNSMYSEVREERPHTPVYAEVDKARQKKRKSKNMD